VSFADPASTVAAVLASGLCMPKVQASAALHAADPAAARAALARFVEPRYLHQVRAAPWCASKYHHCAEDVPLTTAITAGARPADSAADSAVERATMAAAEVAAAEVAAAEVAAAEVAAAEVAAAEVAGAEVAGAEAADDLPEAFDRLPAGRPWRVHFHVPLHATPEPPLAATTDVLAAACRQLYGGAQAASPHIEVETYTWGVLPERQRPTDDATLVAGIAAELRYARDLLVQCGLSAEGT
jgi:hypothetical protein